MNRRRVMAMLRKHMYVTKHSLDRVMDLFYWPFMSLLLWGFTTKYLSDYTSGPNLANLFLGGLILYTFFQRMQQDVSLYILEDFWSWNLNNIFVTPLTLGEFIVSTLVLGLFRAIITFVVLGIGALLIYSFNIMGGGVFGIVALAAALMLFAWALGLFVTSFIFYKGTQVQFFTWSVAFLIQPFVGVYYPVTVLPAWMINVAYLLPPTYVFEGMRLALSTGVVPWYHIGMTLALDVPYLIGAYWVLKKSIEHARKSGRIAST